MGVHRCIAVVRMTVGGDAEQLDVAEQLPTVELPHTGGVQAAAAAAHDDPPVSLSRCVWSAYTLYSMYMGGCKTKIETARVIPVFIVKT